MQAVILIGHGSLRSASGAAMIRSAARLRQRGVAQLVAPAFLNYNRPTLAETVVRLRAQGATQIWVQPYFLIAGAYVQQDLPALVERVAAEHPDMTFRIGDPLGDHPALIDLAWVRVQAAAAQLSSPAGTGALLLMAHGTPLPTANVPLGQIARAVAQRGGFAHHRVAYLDCNTPTIPDGLAELVTQGAAQVVALPYFLHLGRHVREDLPRLVAQAAAALPQVTIVQAHHLGYDLRLVDALAARILGGTTMTHDDPHRRTVAIGELIP